MTALQRALSITGVQTMSKMRKLYENQPIYRYLVEIVEPKILLWLMAASGVAKNMQREALLAAKNHKSMMAQSAAIRRVVPWDVVETALWSETAQGEPRRSMNPRGARNKRTIKR